LITPSVDIKEIPLPDVPIIITPIEKIDPAIPISIETSRRNSELRREDSEQQKSPETPDSGSGSATPRYIFMSLYHIMGMFIFFNPLWLVYTFLV
jgi:hypothetical protein